ncbi:peptide MFS transporter [Pasteurellaceae bacterium LIM206]|nr:peptide MFS transporter [Pasteurellaceae bacterium LIM206]
MPTLKEVDHAFLGHPKPLSGLFFVEMWERFSYYGIRPLLVLFMTTAIIKGGFGFDDTTASAIYGIFAGSIYLAPLAGGWLADNWLGQDRALWWGCVIMALGHLSIGLSSIPAVAQPMFFLGLLLLVLGTGLFKTCISVMVGSLYDQQDPRRDAGFTLFYMGINIGAFVAPLITGIFAENGLWHTGFAVGGIGMLIALLIYRFVAQPALHQYSALKGQQVRWDKPEQTVPNIAKVLITIGILAMIVVLLIFTGVISVNVIMIRHVMTYLIIGTLFIYFAYLFLSPKFNRDEKIRLLVCFLLIIGASLFWSSFDQQATSFNLFADRYVDRELFGFTIPTVWFQSIGSIFIVLFAPLMSLVWLKLARRGINPNSMIKFALGMLFAAACFGLMIIATQDVIMHNIRVSPLWLVAALFLLTIGELCLSPVGLSSMTKLAPARIQSVVMGLFFISISLGGLIGSYSGNYVSGETLADLPNLFTVLTIFLVVSALLLIALARPIQRLLQKNDPNAQL